MGIPECAGKGLDAFEESVRLSLKGSGTAEDPFCVGVDDATMHCHPYHLWALLDIVDGAKESAASFVHVQYPTGEVFCVSSSTELFEYAEHANTLLGVRLESPATFMQSVMREKYSHFHIQAENTVFE